MRALGNDTDDGTARFLALAFGIAWAGWLPMAAADAGLLGSVRFPEIMKDLAAWSPSVAAFLLVGLRYGASGARRFFTDGLRLRGPAIAYVIALAGPAAVGALAILGFIALGGPAPEWGDPSGLWQLPLMFAYVLVLGGPLGEEYGWRGYLLPRLVMRRSPARAALLVGAIWSAWHLPLFFIHGTIQSQVGFGWYSLLTMGLSVVYTYLFLMTQGSVLVAVLLHTAGNLTAGVLPLLPGSVTPGAPGQFPVFAVAVAAIAVGLLPALKNR